MSLNQTIIHVVRKQGGFSYNLLSRHSQLQNQATFPRAISRWVFNNIQGWSGQSPRANDSPVLVLKKASPMSSLIFFHLTTIVLSSSQSVLWRAWLHLLSVVPYWFLGFPETIFPPDSTRPCPSASPCRVNNTILIILVAFPWTPAFLVVIQIWMQYSRCGLVSAEQKVTIPSHDCSISCSWLVGTVCRIILPFKIMFPVSYPFQGWIK